MSISRSVVARRAFMVILAAMFVVFGTASAELLEIYQVDFNFDGTQYQDTEWGAVQFTYTGQTEIMYFNLAINDSWQVQNAPILSAEGVGVEQTITLYFDLGSTRGDDVSLVDYGYQFTPFIFDYPPTTDTTAVVEPQDIVLYSGTGGKLPEPEPAKKHVGGKAKTPVKHSLDPNKFPNQPAGPNECTPTAISNSLNFLNNDRKLGIDPNEITIEKMVTL